SSTESHDESTLRFTAMFRPDHPNSASLPRDQRSGLRIHLPEQSDRSSPGILRVAPVFIVALTKAARFHGRAGVATRTRVVTIRCRERSRVEGCRSRSAALMEDNG